MSISGASIFQNKPTDGLTEIANAAQASETENNQETAEVAKDNLQAAQKQEECDTDGKNIQAANRKLEKVKAHTSTVDRTKKSAQGKTKLLPVENIKEFLNGSKYSPKKNELDELQGLVHDGMSKEDILALVKSKFPKPEDAHLAFEFLSDISKDELKEAVNAARGEYFQSEDLQRRKEHSDKVANDNAAPVAKAKEGVVTSETESLAKEAGLEAEVRFAEHIISNPIEAPALYKLIDDNKPSVIKECTKLIHVMGEKVANLKNLDDKDNIVEMKGTLPALKKIQAIHSMEKGFEIKIAKLNQTLNNTAAAA